MAEVRTTSGVVAVCEDVAHVRLTANGVIRTWNRGSERSTGWRASEVTGRSATDVLAGPNESAWMEAILAETRDCGHWHGRLDMRNRQGQRLTTRAELTLLRNGSEATSEIACVWIDVSEATRGRRRLRALDGWMRSLADTMSEGLLQLDTEGRLVHINRAAEEMLGYRFEQMAGGMVHDVIHPRLDGRFHRFDECPMGRFRRGHELVKVESDVFVRADGSPLPVSYSAAPQETEDGRRGAMIVFSERRLAESDATDEARHWSEVVRSALDEDRLDLDAQPILGLASGDICQHELLLRLNQPDGERLTAADFLEPVERTPLIVDLDRWVIRQAAHYAAEHSVHVNLSAVSMATPDILSTFSKAVAVARADPANIVIELTESAILTDEDAAVRFANSVKAVGCRLALDDFGTGYSGMHYLKHLPVDYVKIDREFVTDLVLNAASRHVVSAVVGLARDFDIRTVAEGAEDALTVDLLRDMGVDCVQGYAVGRPEPASSVLT